MKEREDHPLVWLTERIPINSIGEEAANIIEPAEEPDFHPKEVVKYINSVAYRGNK